MNTEQTELDDGQSYINQHAKDRLISEDLWDIILCNVKKVISEINEEDLTHLDTYYNFPRKRGVHLRFYTTSLTTRDILIIRLSLKMQ